VLLELSQVEELQAAIASKFELLHSLDLTKANFHNVFSSTIWTGLTTQFLSTTLTLNWDTVEARLTTRVSLEVN